MSKKIIVVILQSLDYETAISKMNYMSSLVKNNSCQFAKVDSEDAFLFRPVYEEMVQNKNYYINAMLNNQIMRMPNRKNIFQLAKDNGLKTGAAAYYWANEVYSGDAQKQKGDGEGEASIQYSTYYSRQSYPDHDLFTESEFIRKKYDPNLLLVHSMGIEYAANRFGVGSEEYEKKITEIDNTLELVIPLWLEAGYNILVTAEVGKGLKGNNEKTERALPLWAIGGYFDSLKLENKIAKVGLAETIYDILKVKKPEKFINCNLP